MLRSRIVVGLFVLAAGAAACNGGSTTIVPRTHSSGTPSSAPTQSPSPTPTPSSGSTLSPSAVSTALQSVQNYYATLPHTDPVSDIAAVAHQMVASGAFKAANVTPGGITGTLPDGHLALVFADAPEDVDPAIASDAAPHRPVAPAAQRVPALQTASHGITFLVNQLDTVAFRASQYADLSQAFINLGFPNAGYAVDDADVSLGSIISIGHSHPIDMLVIATHGMVAFPAPAPSPSGSATPAPTGTPFLTLQSTNSLDDPTIASQYQADIQAGNLIPSVYLTITGQSGTSSKRLYGFTPGFLAAHLSFNPGALIYNTSCYGGNAQALPNTIAALQSAPGGIGRYDGWTKSVGAKDAVESLGFMLDRMLGEQSQSVTGLDHYANQRTPPQRPFHVDDVQTAMGSEDRNSPVKAPQSEFYTVSDLKDPENATVAPTGDTAAYLIFDDVGAESMSTPPIVYLMPSITTMSVAESPTNGTLTINGDFPFAPGGVLITDNAGPHLFPPSNWTAHQVTVTIPASGPGSAGNVQVLAVDATPSIGSNAAPLTQWSGVVTYQESDDITSMGGVSGTGSGSLTATFNITFRSDVHPTVAQIDSASAPQNLYFQTVEGNSTAAVTALSGMFTSSQGTPPPATASLSLSSVSNMTPKALPLSAGTFIAGGYPGQPSPCNNASPGPEGDQGNIFCPAFGYKPPLVGVCTADADDPDLCAGRTDFSPGGSFGAAGLIDPGLVAFTMDPNSYAITVNGPDTSFSRNFDFNAWQAHASVSGTINLPSYAPTTTTPAMRQRQPAPSR